MTWPPRPAPWRAIRTVSNRAPPQLESQRRPRRPLQLRVRVTPGASRSREGIRAVRNDDDDAVVELCVAARARDGEANEAVIRVLSAATGVPRWRLVLGRGLRSRDKTVFVEDVEAGSDATILDLLRRASCER